MTDNFERALEERLLARSQVSSRDVEALRLFARTLPARRSFWRRPAFQWALSAAAVVLAAVVALPMLFRIPGFGSDVTPTPTAPVPTQPGPTAPAEPTVAPPVSFPAPSPQIGLGPIRLAVASGSVVNVEIDDPDDLVTGAVGQQADPGMSFAWFNSEVTDAGDNAIRVLWVGYPRDEEVRLEVSESDSGGLLLHFVQAAPLPNTDGEGEDRLMVLYLSEDVAVEDVEVTFDTP
jgi:hypothetical protein